MTQRKSARPHKVGTGHTAYLHCSRPSHISALNRARMDWLKIQAGVVVYR